MTADVTSNSQPNSSPLWEFAVALYSNPAVEETALGLQNDHGINVNILLWACWLDAGQQPVTQNRFTDAEALIAPLQSNYVEPIRTLRRRAANASNKPLKAALLNAELEAEKLVLNTLYQHSQSTDKLGAPSILLNVSAYLRYKSLNEGDNKIETLLLAAIQHLQS